jgi:hypothetical protein
MQSRAAYCVVWSLVASPLIIGSALAQDASPEDETINAIRQLPQINQPDQRRIGEWVQLQVDKLAALPDPDRQAASVAFRKKFKGQYDNPANTPPFRAQLAAQTATVAAAQLGNPKLDQWVGFALARVLADMDRDRVETLPGLVAGLRSRHEAARYLCAEGLSSPKAAIAADKAKLDEAVDALKKAALAETSPIVLGRTYLALGHGNQVPAVLDAYLAIFDKRLGDRRGGAVAADGAEVEAFEFFRSAGVLAALNADQKAQLTQRLAVFLRLDAERYKTAGLDFYELDRLERMMDSVEALLAELAGPTGKGGKIRDELAAGGPDRRAEVLAEAYKWVGHPQSKEPGALNSSPSNVPIGAP